MIFDKLEKRGADKIITFKTLFSTDTDDMESKKEENYFTCLNILANSIAKLSIDIKEGSENATNFYLYDLLKLRCNGNMSSFDTIKSLIMMYKHYGKAGLYIDRNKTNGRVIGLYPVKIENVYIDDLGLINSTNKDKVLIEFRSGDVSGSCFDKDIIYLKDNSFDGIKGKATNKTIKTTLESNIKAQSYQKDLFANGLTNKAAVQIMSDIKEEKELRKIQEKFNRLYSSTGRVFTIPAGYTINPLNLSLADSQFVQLKDFSKKSVASAMGIPYPLIDKGILAEDESLSYLTNTIQPILTQLEQELNYKLLILRERQKYCIKFNVNSMLRVNPEKQMNIITNYVKMGIYSLEEARRILGINEKAEGETVVFPSGQVLLKDLVEGNLSYLDRANEDTPKGGE